MIAYKKVGVFFCFFSTVAMRFLVNKADCFPLEFFVNQLILRFYLRMQQRRKVDPVKQILARLDEKQSKVQR